MRDHRKCTVYDVQRELSALAAVLQTVEQRLKRIAKGIQPSLHLLPVELRGRIETVRIDLLSDAVGTLKGLSQLTENDVAFDRARLADLAERLRVVHVHSAELRPRDRLLRHGPVGLTDAELLAVLFRGGSSLEAAEGLLRDAGGLSELLATDRPALRRCCWPAGSCCDA